MTAAVRNYKIEWAEQKINFHATRIAETKQTIKSLENEPQKPSTKLKLENERAALKNHEEILAEYQRELASLKAN